MQSMQSPCVMISAIEITRTERRIWSGLVDMSPYSRSNSGYKYLLTVIDVFSKCGWIVPLKTKTGKEVATVLQELLLNIAPPSRL